MSTIVGLKKKKLNYVPPDGGWGYAIWIAVIINTIATTAFSGCFGIIYKELFIDFNMGSTSITLLNGINAICVSISGFIAGSLLKFISVRRVGFVAVVFLNLGSLGLVFVNSKIVLFICHGLLFGIGHGVLTILSYTVVTAYFVKRRLLSFSLCQSISVVAAIFSPQLVKYSLKFYGLRGTLMFLLAINLHTLVAVCLMQPVSWHYKTIEIEVENDTEMQTFLDKEKRTNETVKIINEDIYKNNVIIHKEPQLNLSEKKPDSYKNIILKAVDLPLLRSFLLSNAALSLAVCGSSDITFNFILPQILYSLKFTEDQVALAVSLAGFGDLLTKIMFTLFNNFLIKFKSQQIFVVGVFLAAATRTAMLTTTNVTAILTFLTIMGVSRCTIFLLIPLVIGDAVKPEQFTSATGIFMLSFGFINLLLAPTIGAVRDLTDSYQTALFILTMCFIVIFISCTTELFIKYRNKHKESKKISSVRDDVRCSDSLL